MAESASSQSRCAAAYNTPDRPDLNLIASVCAAATEPKPDASVAMSVFHRVATPRHVQQLVQLARMALSDTEREELARVIDELMSYVKLVPDERGTAKPIDRDALILRARQLCSAIGL